HEAAGGLGESAVVADQDADLQFAGIARQREDFERPVAWRREAVDTQERQVNLAIDMDLSGGTDESAGVEESAVLRPLLEHAHCRPDLQSAAILRQKCGRRTRNRLAERPGLLLALEAVAGQRTLGEYDQPRPLRGGLFQGLPDMRQVRRLL